MGSVVGGLRAYRMIAAMWMRSTMAYRASFVMTTVANFAVTGLDFVAILLMFSRVDVLGGWPLAEVAFLYGLSSVAFGLADLAIGSMERLGQRVRDGTRSLCALRRCSRRWPPTASGCAASGASRRGRWCSGTPCWPSTSAGRR
jgi:ABC-2 type transport system permease protein